MLAERRRSKAANNGSTHVGRRGSLEGNLQHQLESKGLRFDFESDGVYDEMDKIKQVDVIKQMAVSIEKKRQLR
jgi:hypothetical protein